MFIRNHMEDNPQTIAAEATLGEVVAILERSSVGYLPVVDQDGQFVGMLTDRDVWWRICQAGEAALNAPVAECLSGNCPMLDLAASMEDAMLLFCDDDDPEALPIVDSRGRLRGVFTRRQLIRELTKRLCSRSGSRIEIALLNPSEDLVAVFEVLRQCEADILSATAACFRDDGDDPILSIRLAQCDGRPVERALAHAGLLLLVPEAEQETQNGKNEHSHRFDSLYLDAVTGLHRQRPSQD